MMYRVQTLWLVAVVIMASGASSVPVRVAGPGPVGLGRGGVTRFACAHCTSTGQLSSRGLFLNRAAVRRHIAASKPCFAADQGFREIQVDSEGRACGVMAGAGGAAGPAPDVRHQPPGDGPPQRPG